MTTNEETKLTRAIIDALNLLPGVWCMRVNSGQGKRGGRYIKLAPKGTADIVGCCDGHGRRTVGGLRIQMASRGRFFGLEVKLPGEDLSDDQREWAATITTIGGYVATVRSVAEALKAIEEARYG